MDESKNNKTRNKTVVARCFNKIGIVVPVDANDVGYRPLPMTNGKNFQFSTITVCGKIWEGGKYWWIWQIVSDSFVIIAIEAWPFFNAERA